jgi:hypothetical protein
MGGLSGESDEFAVLGKFVDILYFGSLNVDIEICIVPKHCIELPKTCRCLSLRRGV